MININPEFEGSYNKNTGGFYEGYSSVPESKLFTDKDSKRLEIYKVEASVERFKKQIDEIELELREIELEHPNKEYKTETFNIVKQLKDIKRKVEVHIEEAENYLRELREAGE